jgi:signal peptidase II
MSSPGSNNGRVFWTTAAIVICLDVATKMLAVRHLDLHIPLRVVGDVVRLTLAYNPGAAFSMSLGNYSRYIFGAFAVIALFILWRLYRTTVSGDMTRVLALGLAWGGAAGNLLDRFRSSRGVVDFIDIGVGDVRFWTFNVADSAVTVGALLLAWVLWQEDRAANAAARASASGAATGEGGEARSSS